MAIRDKIAGEGVAVRDKTAGESVAIRDKIAGGEAAYDNTAGERVDEEADESTIEEIVIDSIVDKIAGGEAADDNTAGERVEVLTGGRGSSGRRD